MGADTPAGEASGGSENVVARGSRVLLRHPVEEDEARYVDLVRVSRDFHRPWQPIPPADAPDAASPEGFRAWLAGAEDPRVEHLLLCRNGDGALVGRFHLNEVVRGAFQSAYLSYWVGSAFAGQGLMSEGMDLMLGHAFGPLGLHRVEANIQPANAPSLALVRRAGFRREGFSERYLKIAGDWADHERWALTVEDWENLRNGP